MGFGDSGAQTRVACSRAIGKREIAQLGGVDQLGQAQIGTDAFGKS